MLPARLALIPACWLALSGAVPAPAPLDTGAECRAPRAQVTSVLAGLPVEEVRASDEGGEITYYQIPRDLRAFGYAPVMLALSVSSTPGSEHMQLLTVVRGPYADVERRVLAAHGQDACPERIPGEGNNCTVNLTIPGGGTAMMVIQDFDDGAIGINCAYPVPRSK